MPNMQLLLTHTKDQEETIEGYVLHLEQVCEDLYNLKAENKRLQEHNRLLNIGLGAVLEKADELKNDLDALSKDKP